MILRNKFSWTYFDTMTQYKSFDQKMDNSVVVCMLYQSLHSNRLCMVLCNLSVILNFLFKLIWNTILTLNTEAKHVIFMLQVYLFLRWYQVQNVQRRTTLWYACLMDTFMTWLIDRIVFFSAVATSHAVPYMSHWYRNLMKVITRSKKWRGDNHTTIRMVNITLRM